jgi:predicted metalloendopeptidase
MAYRIKHNTFAALSAKPKKWVTRIVCGMLVVTASLQVHADLFRYRDENGQLVLSHTIPNDRVKAGYEIVDEYGVLIKRVEPQLSEAAYREKLRREAAFKECLKTMERVRKLYQTEADIDYALNKGLESIDQSINNIKANLSVTSNQRQEFEEQAGQLDIQGRDIPNALLDNIERAKSQERTFNEEIEKRYAEKLRLRKSNEFDRKVFALDNCDNGLPPFPG